MMLELCLGVADNTSLASVGMLVSLPCEGIKVEGRDERDRDAACSVRFEEVGLAIAGDAVSVTEAGDGLGSAVLKCDCWYTLDERFTLVR